MRPKLEQLSHLLNKQSVLCYELSYPSFEFYWHYHPEYELTFIANTKGKRLVGDSFEPFAAGDLVLLPPNLPHTWITEPAAGEMHTAIIIQFSKAFIRTFLEFNEFEAVHNLLERAEKGIFFPDALKTKAYELIKKLPQNKGISTLTGLLQLLDVLAGLPSVSLTSAGYKLLKGNENEMRINQVFGYVQEKFNQEISLQKAAGLVHLSESAFCKFFKRLSGKTFSDYVNEIRIANACRLLIETDKSVSAIAHESGYDSMTYFNRVFRKKKDMSPVEFRRIR
jgi:AraC-like DNA-binding protein